MEYEFVLVPITCTSEFNMKTFKEEGHILSEVSKREIAMVLIAGGRFNTKGLTSVEIIAEGSINIPLPNLLVTIDRSLSKLANS